MLSNFLRTQKKLPVNMITPSFDLLLKVKELSSSSPNRVLDLGSSDGNNISVRSIFPMASVRTLDSRPPDCIYESNTMIEGIVHTRELARLKLLGKYDLILSNGAFQWYDPKIMEDLLVNFVANNGILAVQMPGHNMISLQNLVIRAAHNAGIFEDIEHVYFPHLDNKMSMFYNLLNDKCKSIDIWQTDYLHVFKHANEETPHPLIFYAIDVGLCSVLSAVSSNETYDYDEVMGYLKSDLYLQELNKLICEAYPPDKMSANTNTTLFQDSRIFLIAQK